MDKTGCTNTSAVCDGQCVGCGWHSAEIRRRKMILERDGLTQVGPVRAPEWRVRCIRCQGVNVARMGRRGTAYIAWPEELA